MADTLPTEYQRWLAECDQIITHEMDADPDAYSSRQECALALTLFGELPARPASL